MANTIQAKKRVRQTARRTATNRSRINRIRTFIRRVEAAVERGDAAAAKEALAAAEPEIMRGATKGVLHRNTAARKVSRLSARVKAIS